MNLRDEFFKAVNNVKDVVAVNFAGLTRKSEIDTMVNQFKVDYINYYKGMPILQNITQSFWYTLYLTKRRLDENGIHLSLQLQRMNYTDNPLRITWSNDGKYVSASILEEIYSKRIYTYGSKKLGTLVNKELLHYVAIESLKEDATYICPNCGAKSTLESLIDGCDYCHTKFHLEDFDKKIVSIDYQKDPASNQARGFDASNKITIITGFIGLLIGIFTFLLPELNNFSDDSIAIIIRVMVCAGIGAFLGKVSSMAKSTLGTVKRSISQASKNLGKLFTNAPFENKVREFDPLFSIDSFLGSLTNKLQSIHFARNQREIDAFVKCNLQNILPQYENVLECNLDDVTFESFRVDNQNQIIQMSATLKLLIKKRNRLKTTKEYIGLTLIKDKNTKTQSICDTSVFTCKSCGSSINLLNGGLCEHCHTSLDLRLYDFIIVDYQIG